MGRGKFWWEPAHSLFGLLGLVVIKVSLCGPHWLDTSALRLTVVEVVLSGLASPPLSRMNSYLLHQVGSFELFCACTFRGGLEMPRLNATNPMTTRIGRYTLFFIEVLPCWIKTTQAF